MAWLEEGSGGRGSMPDGKWYPDPLPRMRNGRLCDSYEEWIRIGQEVSNDWEFGAPRYDATIRKDPMRAQREPPLQWRLKRRRKWFPDRISFGTDTHSMGNFVCSDRFKRLVESVEPGIHLFFPIQILQPDLEPWHQMYWVFDCMTRLQSVSVEDSPGLDWEPLRDPRNGYVRKVIRYPTVSKNHPDFESQLAWRGYSENTVIVDPADFGGRYPGRGMCVDRQTIAGYHLWIDKIAFSHGRYVLFSDLFQKLMLRQNISGFSSTYRNFYGKVIDSTYIPEIDRSTPPYEHINSYGYSS